VHRTKASPQQAPAKDRPHADSPRRLPQRATRATADERNDITDANNAATHHNAATNANSTDTNPIDDERKKGGPPNLQASQGEDPPQGPENTARDARKDADCANPARRCAGQEGNGETRLVPLRRFGTSETAGTHQHRREGEKGSAE
jgi:hypothetical protein